MATTSGSFSEFQKQEAQELSAPKRLGMITRTVEEGEVKRIAGSLLVIALVGCSSVSGPGPGAFSPEIARVVSEVSAHVPSRGAPVLVRFSEPVGATDAELADTGAVRFSPKLRFDLSWQDDRTLAAMPRSPLEPGVYITEWDIGSLTGAKVDEPLRWSFRVVAPDVTSSELVLEAVDGGYRMVGTITFTQPIEPAALEADTRLKAGATSYDVEIAPVPGDETTMRVTSAPIPRGEQSRSARLSISTRRTGIATPYTRDFVVPETGRLSVIDVAPIDGDIRSGYRIELSDPVDARQNLDGLIRTEPEVEANIRTEGSTVLLLGKFEPGRRYTLLVNGDVRSSNGVSQGEDRSFALDTPDLEPAIEYLSSGVFLPSANKHVLGFRTRNLRAITLTVQRVFENNLGQFLQTESLASRKQRTSYFNYTYMNRVGVEIENRRLTLGETRNEWIVSGIDLADVFADQPKGLYVISLRYTEEDIVASPPGYSWRYWESAIYKPVIESDIGLTYKRGAEGDLVFVADLLTGRPMRGVRVSVLTYQQQEIAQGVSDELGFVDLPSRNVAGEPFYVTGEKDGQRSVVKLSEMSWNVSSFETGGVEVPKSGTRAFLYTERGVYRPGDPVHLSAIIRNQRDTFPEGHPVTFKWYNPRGQLVDEINTNDGIDGFYSVVLQTEDSDPTGEWRVELDAAGTSFGHVVSIETVVPFRLKVRVESPTAELTADDGVLDVSIESDYLFGTPASGLKAEATVSLAHRTKRFDAFPGYLFDDEGRRYASIRRQLFAGPLDSDGHADLSWELPDVSNAPSALAAEVQARVFEKGGRPNLGSLTIPVEPHERYVGLRKPDLKYGYVRLGNDLETSAVLVDGEGEPVAETELTYAIYRNRSYWWWEYDSREDFRLHYQSDQHTEFVAGGALLSDERPVTISFTPEEWGEHYLVVSDANGTHSAGYFFRASWWGAAPAGADDASLLALRADRQLYRVGDTAQISFPSPPDGTVLLTLENARGVLDRRVISLSDPSAAGVTTREGETTVEISLTEEMVPNAYVALSLIQPHLQTINDRPLRLYGIVPLVVEDPDTRKTVTIETAESFRPNQPFTVRVATDDRTRTQFTLAVVDEGLLDITRFDTPDPWEAFYRKQRLGVSTYDLYSHVIGANDGGFFNIFSVGGGYDQGLYAAGADEDTQRFEPVSMFVGPIWTDSSGMAEVELEMPNYMGSVRVMAVASDGGALGSAERTVPVKDDLLVLSSLPRVLGPAESFEIPVTVFGLTEGLGRVTVSLDVDGPVSIEGDRVRAVNFDATGERDLVFRAKTDAAIGAASFTIRAVAMGANVTDETTVVVRASSPRVSEKREETLGRGESVSIRIPGDGLEGTNRGSLFIARQPDLDIADRLRWLVRYPYGCIEQTTSAVFPQLYLGDLADTDEPELEDIDANINRAIARLRKFQLASGGFSFWPGGSDVSSWGTNYAGHFLTEARRLGYYVPEDLYSGWVRFQTSQALSSRDGLRERVYRVYLLALAGEPSVAAMNLLYESTLDEMDDTMKWQLASAYLLRGMEHTAGDILVDTGIEPAEYDWYGSTYGSSLRDSGMILDSLLLFGRWSEAQAVFRDLARRLSGDGWYSTQSVGYALLAMGKYLEMSTAGATAPRLSGAVLLPDGETVQFDTDERSVRIPIESGFGGDATVTLDANTDLERAFVAMEWEGIPLRSGARPVARNLSVAASWYRDDGRPLDPARLTQGTSFWGVFRVSKTDSRPLTELALVSMLPSGWEIENLRLSGEALPDFLAGRKVNVAEYTDIRDDRIMWFFDLEGYERSREFAVKVNAVTVGTFYLPQVTFEAMYDDDYYASRPGREVSVLPR